MIRGRLAATLAVTAFTSAAAPLAAQSPAATPALPPAQDALLLTIPDSTLFPEGLSRDAARARWLVSSVAHGTIVALSDAGTLTPFASLPDSARGAILGIRVDSARGVLWATTAALPQARGVTAADSMRAAVLRFSLTDGRLLDRYELPSAPVRRVPGDIALASDGTLYVSDASASRLYVLAPRAREFRVMTSPLFASLQGIVLPPGGDVLVGADYRNGLLRIPLNGDSVTQIPAAEGRRLQGLDGVIWYGDGVVATYNGRLPGRVVHARLTPDLRAITSFAVLVTVDGPGEPTLGERLGDDFIYIAHSPWGAFDEQGQRKPEVVIALPALRRLPLPRITTAR